MRRFFKVLAALLLMLVCIAPASAQGVGYSRSTLHFGDYSGWRPAPTTGTLTGAYWTQGPWVQTGPITCKACRLHFGGDVTINNAITGTAGADPGTASQPSFIQSANRRGGGGGRGGAGGHAPGLQSGGPAMSNDATTVPVWPLAGQGGWDDGASTSPGAGGAGGAGLYIEANGNVLITSAGSIVCTGAAGSSSGFAGGGGSGGGIDIRALGSLTLQAGAALTANGGAGGNGSGGGDSGGGGGAGTINLEALAGVTNAGTLTVNGGAGGTGGAGAGTAGAAGITIVGVQFSGARRSE